MGLSSSNDPETVMGRRRQLAAQLGFALERALMTVQEHGANVVTFPRRRPEGGQCVFSTDALATDVPGQAIVTYHADCFRSLFADTSRRVVAGAHAGWRGALAGVATQTVQAMHLAYGTSPDQLDMLIGPGICRRCYPVGRDIAEQFASRYGREARYIEVDDGDVRLDLAGVVRLQLEDAGVEPDRIRSAGWGTREGDRWVLHRGGPPRRLPPGLVAPLPPPPSPHTHP